MKPAPDSFNLDHIEDWGSWVLDNGLPSLPEQLGPDDSVPVARWAGARFGAVMFVEWGRLDDDAEENEIWNEIQLFVRRGTGWESSDGSGGGNWFDPPFERPPMPAREVAFRGETQNGGGEWYACAVDGIAGIDGATVELGTLDGATQMRLESPLGAFVVAADCAHPAVIRVLSADGAVLGEYLFQGDDSA